VPRIKLILKLVWLQELTREESLHTLRAAFLGIAGTVFHLVPVLGGNRSDKTVKQSGLGPPDSPEVDHLQIEVILFDCPNHEVPKQRVTRNVATQNRVEIDPAAGGMSRLREKDRGDRTCTLFSELETSKAVSQRRRNGHSQSGDILRIVYRFGIRNRIYPGESHLLDLRTPGL